MKSDRRIRKTKCAIQEAFLSLLVEKEFNDITITELARRADIDRKTFYAHYASLGDIVDDLKSDFLEEISRLISSDMNAFTIQNFFRYLNEFHSQHEKLMYAILHRVSMYPFIDSVKDAMYNLMIERFHKEPIPDISEQEFSAIIHYVIGGMENLYISWAKTGKKIQFPQLQQMTERLVRQNIGDLLGWDDKKTDNSRQSS